MVLKKLPSKKFGASPVPSLPMAQETHKMSQKSKSKPKDDDSEDGGCTLNSDSLLVGCVPGRATSVLHGCEDMSSIGSVENVPAADPVCRALQEERAVAARPAARIYRVDQEGASEGLRRTWEAAPRLVKAWNGGRHERAQKLWAVAKANMSEWLVVNVEEEVDCEIKDERVGARAA